MAAWKVLLTGEVQAWLAALASEDAKTNDPGTVVLVRAAIRILAEDGPALGRPLVDTIKGSTLKNLKELRPGSSGRSEVRILFAFDTRGARRSCSSQETRALTGKAGTRQRSRRPSASTRSIWRRCPRRRRLRRQAERTRRSRKGSNHGYARMGRCRAGDLPGRR